MSQFLLGFGIGIVLSYRVLRITIRKVISESNGQTFEDTIGGKVYRTSIKEIVND